MREKKTATYKTTPRHVIQCGQVTAHIFERQSPSGYPYFDFSLSRTWKNKSTGRESHSPTFFDGNHADIASAARKASGWILEQHQAAVADPADPQ